MATTTLPFSWQDVVSAELGHVFHDEVRDGLRFVILRSTASLCAYIGVPNDHPLAGESYESLPVRAHGGLTYAGHLQHLSKDRYWYGWDYAHCGDFSVYDENLATPRTDEKKWTPADVLADSWETISDFQQLMTLAESVARKAKAAR